MRALPALALTAIVAPALILVGCKSKEEEAAERDALKSQIKQEVLNDLTYQVQQEVDRQLKQAIADHQRRLAETRAAEEAAKKAAPPAGNTGAKKPGTATPAPAPKKR